MGKDHKNWTLHFLNARNQFADHAQCLIDCIKETEARLSDKANPFRLDIVLDIQLNTIPKALSGVSGFAPRAGVIYITLDPAEAGLDMPAIQRTLMHEFHHALRWESVGYGQTLFEAIITEGLAGHFVQEMLGTPPEPWETALKFRDLRVFQKDLLRDANDSAYSHAEWFFGIGPYPNWLGYSFGYQIVGRFLKAYPLRLPSNLAAMPARHFMDFVREGGVLPHH